MNMNLIKNQSILLRENCNGADDGKFTQQKLLVITGLLGLSAACSVASTTISVQVLEALAGILALSIFAWRWPRLGLFSAAILDLTTLFSPAPSFSIGLLKIGLRPSTLVLPVLLLSPYTYKWAKHKQVYGVPVPTRFVCAIVLLTATVGISTLLTPLVDVQFSSFYYVESIKRYIRWLSGMLFLLIAIKLPWNRKEAETFSIVSCFIIAIATVQVFQQQSYALAELMHVSRWDGRLAGAAVTPNELGEILVLFFLVSFAALHFSVKTSLRLLVVLTALTLLTAVAFTFSRESWVTLLGAVAFLTWTSRSRLPMKIAGTCFLLLCVLLALTATPFGEYLLWTIRTWSLNPEQASSGRVRIWATALDVGIRHLFTGVGFWGFEQFSGGLNTAAHNGFLQSLVVGGVLGFGAYIWFLKGLVSYICTCGAKEEPPFSLLARVVQAFLFGFLISNLVSDHFFSFPVLNSLLGVTISFATGQIKVDTHRS